MAPRLGSPSWARPRLMQDIGFASLSSSSSSSQPSLSSAGPQTSPGGSKSAVGGALRRRGGPAAAAAVAALTTIALLFGLGGAGRTSLLSVRPHLDPSVVYTGTPWSTERTVSVTNLGETPFARCDLHAVRSEDGASIVRDWIFFEERDAVNVIVRNAERKFVVFKQRKYAIPGDSLAPVGGMLEDGESPYDAARREVREELGMGSRREAAERSTSATADVEAGVAASSPLTRTPDGLLDGRVHDSDPDWVHLGTYRTAANRGGGFLYVYLLKDAVPVADGGGTAAFRSSGDDEAQDLTFLTMEEASVVALRGHMFKEVKWAAAMALALLHLMGADSASEGGSAANP